MARWRRTLLLGLAVLAVPLASAAHPRQASEAVEYRDLDGFRNYVTDAYDNGTLSCRGCARAERRQERDGEWARENPDLALAEGDRACAWLRARPSAPRLDPSGHSSAHELVTRYLAETSRSGLGTLSDLGQRTLVVGAWAHLCLPTREDRTAPTSDEYD